MVAPGDDFDPDAPPAPDSGLFGLPHTPDDAAVVVIPAPFDATSPQAGAADVPAAMVEASHGIERHDPLTPDTWRRGVALAEVPGRIAAWNTEARALAAPVLAGRDPSGHGDALSQLDALVHQVDQAVHDAAAAALQRDAAVGILGGNQVVALGGIRAAAETHPGLAVLHLDARADLRPSWLGMARSARSTMYDVVHRVPQVSHIVQAGVRELARAEAELIESSSKITTFTDHELAWELASGEPWMRIAARIERALPSDAVWVSFDARALRPALGPGASDPVPGGLSWRHTQLLLQLLAQRHRLVGFDLCELGSTPRDLQVGARLLYRLAGWACQSPWGA